MTTPNRNRILALMSVPAALVLLGAGSWGAGRVFHDPSLPSAQIVHASPETLNYACPPGIINPFDLDGKVASPTLWNSAGTIEKERILRYCTQIHLPRRFLHHWEFLARVGENCAV